MTTLAYNYDLIATDLTDEWFRLDREERDGWHLVARLGEDRYSEEILGVLGRDVIRARMTLRRIMTGFNRNHRLFNYFIMNFNDVQE